MDVERERKKKKKVWGGRIFKYSGPLPNWVF